MSIWKKSDYCEGCGCELGEHEEEFCGDYCRRISGPEQDPADEEFPGCKDKDFI